MDTIEFRKDFLEFIYSEASVTGEGKCAVFVSNMARYLNESEVLPDYNLSFYDGTGRNGRKYRVDGYALDEFDMTMNLIIADFVGEEGRRLGETGIRQDMSRLSYFIDQALNTNLYKTIELSLPCYGLIDLLRSQKERIRRYRLVILTDAILSDNIKTIDSFEVCGVAADCQIWDIDRLYRVCCSDLGRQYVEIDFKSLTGTGVPCLEASSAKTSEYNSYLCIMPGTVLADIYDKYGSGLLEGNVRSFLSTKVAVNKKIRETILKSPSMFFAYNNGVSATAMGVRVESTPEGKYVVYAKDFQIINGGQTTASLSNARYKDNAELRNIYVQMKLTEIGETDADQANELIRNISKSSNSQNKVSDADFFATSPFHVRMEQISRRLFSPARDGAQYETRWFYERARGQYLQAQMRLTPARKAQFERQNPKNQVITKTDLAKYHNTWLGLPHEVSKGAQTNFMRFAEIVDQEWEENEKRFNDRFFKESVAKALLFKELEKIIPMQPWYEQGYRANIVTYTLALFHLLIKKQYKDKVLDLMGIWNRQSVPEAVKNVFADLSEKVFGKITDPSRQVINVTQWCKRDSCWKSVKEILYSLPADIEKALICVEESKAEERGAVAERKIDSEVEAQTKVLELGPDFWRKVGIFARSKKLGPESTIESLKYAENIPATIPSGYQSIRLLELLQRAESEGFKG